MLGKLLSYASVATLMDCSEDTVRRLVRDGDLPEPKRYKRLGPRFREEDVLRFVFGGGFEGRQEKKSSRHKPQQDANERSEKGS